MAVRKKNRSKGLFPDFLFGKLRNSSLIYRNRKSGKQEENSILVLIEFEVSLRQNYLGGRSTHERDLDIFTTKIEMY